MKRFFVLGLMILPIIALSSFAAPPKIEPIPSISLPVKEKCASFTPSDLAIQERADHWMIIEKTNNVALLDFGLSIGPDAKENLNLADKVLNLIKGSGATEQCYIGDSFIRYYLVGNKTPTTDTLYDFCLNAVYFSPEKVKAHSIGKAGLLVDETNIILPFQNGLNAQIAAILIQKYKFNGLCYDGPRYAPRVTFFLKFER
jgi:hypothetical protein